MEVNLFNQPFKALNAVDDEIARNLWQKQTAILIDESLISKFEPDWIPEIIQFYSYSSDQQSHINELAWPTFRKWLHSKRPFFILAAILKLDTITFKAILGDFQEDIREIITHISRNEAQDLEYNIGYHGPGKRGTDYIKEEFDEKRSLFMPFLQEKLQEKYFFDV